MNKLIPNFREPRIKLWEIERFSLTITDIETMDLDELTSILEKNKKEIIENFPERLRKFKKFLFLFYLGKLPSFIRAPYKENDLLLLQFLYNLQEVAKKHNIKFYIAHEDEHFDKEIFHIKFDKRKVELVYEWLDEFNFDRIELLNLYDILPSKYFEYFYSLDPKPNEDCKKIIFYSFIANSLNETLKAYKENLKEVEKFAEEICRKYVAFIEARKLSRFWENLEKLGFGRATVSYKENALSLDASIDGILPSRGVGVLEGNKLRNYYFIELNDRKAKIKSYGNLKMFEIIE